MLNPWLWTRAYPVPEFLQAFQGDPEQEAGTAALVGSLKVNLT